MPRGRRTEEQIRQDMEDLSTEVALGVGLKGVINSLFRESIDETEGFQGPLLQSMEEAFESALKPYPTSEETEVLHTEYNDMNRKVGNIEDKLDDIEEIAKFLDVTHEQPYNDFYTNISGIVEDKVSMVIQEEIKNAFQDVGKHFVENVLDDFVAKVIVEINKEPETDEEKIARLERENAELRND